MPATLGHVAAQVALLAHSAVDHSGQAASSCHPAIATAQIVADVGRPGLNSGQYLTQTVQVATAVVHTVGS